MPSSAFLRTFGSFLACVWSVAAADDPLVLVLDSVPDHGIVLAQIDLTAAPVFSRLNPARLRASDPARGTPVAVQFVPESDRPRVGVLVLRCPPASGPFQIRVESESDAATGASTGVRTNSVTIRTRWYSLTHESSRQGGLPGALEFASGRKVDLHWNDRLYHRMEEQFWVRHDPHPVLQTVSTGAHCTVVRMVSRFTTPDGRRPASAPEATYDWYYFHEMPWVYLRARVRQEHAKLWHEAHTGELHFKTNALSHWAGGEPRQTGRWQGKDQGVSLARWAVAFEGTEALGLFDAGPLLLYDGRSYGPYLHAHADAAWQPWNSLAFERTAWLWLGADSQPAHAVAQASTTPPGQTRVRLSSGRLQERAAALRRQLEQTPVTRRVEAGWPLAALELLEHHGRFREAQEWIPGQLPPEWPVVAAGNLRLVFERRADGLFLLELIDAATGTALLGTDRLPLFELSLRNATSGQLVRVDSGHGWGKVTWDRAESNGVRLQWRQPLKAGLGGLEVRAELRPDPTRHRVGWIFEAKGQATPWSLWRVHAPRLVLSVISPETQLLLPQAAGVLRPVGRERLTKFGGEYPNGWMTMQLAALYDSKVGTGVYFGLHDPLGSTKDFVAELAVAPGNDPNAVHLAWDIPAPDMGKPGNRAVWGETVWQLFRGDWFDAALIYREWARTGTDWFPQADGRADTPRWMRELSAWALTGGAPNSCVTQVLAFAEGLGVPVGFHWYNWHQIPFDNDYPHYFPTKDGFAAGVKQLQDAGVHVMPYINGRLWDTHDRGATDFAFTRIARSSATKQTNQEPYLESYGSKETNGEPVRLAVMCPATPFWQERQRAIVRQLFQQCGVHGVYIDQIAAAKPQLCFAPDHGHPLGGGAWWNTQGYWPMLDRMREEKPPDRMLTTECNAEPYVRWFDGYLTWHWQHDGQVPLFPAVYGGAIQMFGRAYRGGPSKDLALRMKAAQQLVFGEQLGWIDPAIVREPDNFAFFREAVRVRWHLRRYFHAGQMGRPPALTGDIPKVTADWQWSGTWPVTTPALLAGAWHIASEQRVVLLFGNVSEQAITATVEYDCREAGLQQERLRRRRWTGQGEAAAGEVKPVLRETVIFEPRSVWAWEIRPDLATDH